VLGTTIVAVIVLGGFLLCGGVGYFAYHRDNRRATADVIEEAEHARGE
jgi:uncharacterized membrane protein HdeD (DUF308 family)